MTDLGTLTGAYSEAGGINSAGQVVGYAETTKPYTHAFLWQQGIMTDLGDLGGFVSSASSINDASQVVGRSTTASGVSHAFLAVPTP